MTEKVYLYGKNPLREAILASKRGQGMPIERLFLTKKARETPEMVSFIQTHKLAFETVTYDEIEHMAGANTVHQGICALLDEKMLYTPLEKVLADTKNSSKNSLFILLDELQDPHNVGAIIRSAVAFGADAILIPEHNQTQINGTVIKSASGMNFAIPIVKIGNINTTLKKLKDEGFWTYGLTGDGDTTVHEAKFDSPTVIVVGGEGEGIKMKTLETCDFKLSIKTNPLCESLNASNATTVVMYEWSRQNN
jgi:23S rRNA (guanosine2251-2'-O)-methyltransferase